MPGTGKDQAARDYFCSDYHEKYADVDRVADVAVNACGDEGMTFFDLIFRSVCPVRTKGFSGGHADCKPDQDNDEPERLDGSGLIEWENSQTQKLEVDDEGAER
jgi:hypothetical protein